MENTIVGLSLIDLLGYLAMAVLLVSFTMKAVRKLRIINSFGCVLFAIWGLIIEEWPVVITNISILIINLYYLYFKKTYPRK